MDLEKYRVLLEVIKIGSLSRTADILGYTVSGISRLITALEKEQGFALLYRLHGGVKPTRECELLLPHIKELLLEEEIVTQISEEIKGARKGEISIGVAYSSYYRWLSDVTEHFQRENDGVRFQFINGYSSELLRQMQEHEIDLCLISEREGDHLWIPLGEEELVAWIPEHHRLAGEESISLSTFERERYIDIYSGKDIDNARIFKQYGINPNIYTSAGDSFAVYSMVEAGLGISMNHRSNCAKWTGTVKVLPMEPPLSVPVGIAALKKHTPIITAFLQSLNLFDK